jgi:hypothetical protein
MNFTFSGTYFFLSKLKFDYSIFFSPFLMYFSFNFIKFIFLKFYKNIIKIDFITKLIILIKFNIYLIIIYLKSKININNKQFNIIKYLFKLINKLINK